MEYISSDTNVWIESPDYSKREICRRSGFLPELSRSAFKLFAEHSSEIAF